MENNTEISASEVQNPTECTFDQEACDEKFALAKRNLLCGDVPIAVNQLQDVCKNLATKFGETAPECADAYFQYGVALLELARMENRVLGNALKGVSDIEGEEAEDSFAVPTIMTEEEKEQISDQVIDAMLESSVEAPATVPGLDASTEILEEVKKPEEAQTLEKSEVKPEAVTATVDVIEASSDEKILPPASSESANELKAPGDSSEAVAEDEDEDASDDVDDMVQDEAAEEDTAPECDGSQNEDEDISNLQLAWEMLELSKTIFLKQETKEAKFKSAECLKKLGEVGLESEQYSQSIEDFKTSLEILKTCVDDATSNRRIAETHYHIAVSCVNAQLYDDAVAHFSESISILEAKMVSLNAILNNASGSLEAQEEKVLDARKELKEIEELIPDIRLKIDDAEEEKRSLVELKKETDSMTKGVTVATGFTDSECVTSSSDSPIMVQEVKPVSDVSHLVRKKRKPEEESLEVEGAKKSKTSEEEAEVAVRNDEETNAENTESKENVKPADQSDNVSQDAPDTDGKKIETTAANNVEDHSSLKKNVLVGEPVVME